MINGYIDQSHKDVADFVFKHIEEGRASYDDPTNKKKRPSYSGHDVRHVLQSHGWVMRDLRVCLDEAKARIKELEKVKA